MYTEYPIKYAYGFVLYYIMFILLTFYMLNFSVKT